MSTLVLDSEVLAQLRQAAGRVEIRDKSGVLVGYFTPSLAHRSGLAADADIEVPFTGEDLDRFENEPGGRALDEILTDLRNRS